MKDLFILPKRIEYLFILHYLKNKKPLSFSGFERATNTNIARVDFRNVLKKLIEEGILNYYDSIGNTKRYILNYKKLDKFIQKLPVYNTFYKYIEEKEFIL